MNQLIVSRAVQGVGGGGLFPVAIAMIGDLVSPRQRGQYVAYLMVAFTTATVLGPTLGGRTLPWLALQGTAAATVAATAVTAVRARRLWPGLPGAVKVRLGLLIAGGVAMVPWGRYWRLLRR